MLELERQKKKLNITEKLNQWTFFLRFIFCFYAADGLLKFLSRVLLHKALKRAMILNEMDYMELL